ncbi:MAG: dehydrogenase [Planctomycetaceae bacterium]|nr:dehydrogenase [Planctomycetaceae bacterium]
MPMFRAALLSLLLIASVAPGADTPGSPKADTHQVKLNGHTFTLPKGFEIELAAGADLAPRPIVAAFDTQGRLYVCDSSGSNEKTTVQLEKKPHRILRLESTKGDGRFDKSTVYVKNVMLPEGAMWLNGSLYVAAPPHIWKFTDTDNDGVADKEEIWFDGKTLTGCANDLHGPYLGPDGWIYWTKGAFAKQEYTVNGKKFNTRASHIFRARPDGTGIEPVMTGGMDNPVDLVFTPGGDIIFSTTFFQHPRDGKRDGLIHAVYGGIYGKDHDVLADHPWTSPQLMPVLTHMGPAAPSGLHRLESGEFGKDYANNIFCAQFNLRKVSRHVLVPTGSTYTTKDSDFVVSDNLDFHPTDVIEDADGSLLIVDTGGWYKLCCPTSQLVKPDVTGAIYRVKRTGAHKVDDPRGEKIDWNKLDMVGRLQALNHKQPAVRHRAATALLAASDEGITWLASVPSAPAGYTQDTQRYVLAILAGVDHPKARKAARTALSENGELAMIAIHAAGLWRDKEAMDDLAVLLRAGDNRMRRAAAGAFGRIGDPKVVPALLSMFDHKDIDRALDHSLTYALIEIDDIKGIRDGLKHESPRVRRACLAALSNITGGIEPQFYVAELDAKDSALRETAWWVAGRNPQWAAHVGDYLRDRLKLLPKMTPPEQDELASRLVPFLKAALIRDVVGDALLSTTEPSAQRAILRALAQSGVKAFPTEWKNGVQIALFSRSSDVVRDAIGVLRVVQLTAADHADLTEKVTQYRQRINAPLAKEFAYGLRAAGPVGSPLSVEDATGVIADLHRDRDGAIRGAAAELLARGSLTSESLIALAAALKTVNPVELSKLLGVFAKSTDAAVGSAVVKALRDPAVRAGIRVEMVKPILDKYPKTVQAETEKLYAELAEARKGETARLDKLLADLKPGDIRRGQVVFNSPKTNCIACHKVGYVGGLVGPDLTRVGGTRTERDLLEAIVFPSASFVRSYEPVRVVTTDDRTFNGILKKDAPDEIIIVVAADKEERVARADVASITPSAVSLMPSGLDQQLTPQDLADLVAFLRACK